MLHKLCTTQEKFAPAAGWLQGLSILAARLYIAKVFFFSGLLKLDNWNTTVTLFDFEYGVPLLPPEVAAYMATAGELILPVLLVLGLFTPIAAIGLFIMSAVIELFVYPGTTEHYYWLLLTAIIATHGSGKLGLDYWLMNYCGKCKKD